MGIENLLKLLSSIQINKNISHYKGKKLAIDSYCLLHKSVFYNTDILENPDSDKFLVFLSKKMKMLIDSGIIPIMVFDGDRLPIKKPEEDERQKRRSDVIKQAKDFILKGQLELAKQKMIEGCDVTPQMAYKFIKLLKELKVEFIVAPYEADAQLAYLVKIGYADLVYTEDSDLIALGCPKVILKLDNDGNCVEINLNDIPKVKELDFSQFSHDRFLIFCILSGCDFFKIKGIGYKKAYQIVKEKSDFKDCLRLIKLNPKFFNVLPPKLEELFEKAFLTFKFQVIYCPIEKKMKYLSDISNTIYTSIHKYDLSFLGKIYEDELAFKIVNAIIDPISHLYFENSPKSRKSFFRKENEELNMTINKNSEIEEIKVKLYLEEKVPITPNLLNIKENIQIQSTYSDEMNLYHKNKVFKISSNEIIRFSSQVNYYEENDKNLVDINKINKPVFQDSIDEFNRFDEFLTSFEYADSTIKKQNKSRDSLNNMKIELIDNKVVINHTLSEETNENKLDIIDKYRFIDNSK